MFIRLFPRTPKGFLLASVLTLPVFLTGCSAGSNLNHQNQLIRNQVSEGYMLTDGAKVGVAEFYGNFGSYPTNNASAGIPTARSIRGKYVSQVNIANGVITATFGSRANKAIQNDTFVVSPVASNGSISWTCNKAIGGSTVPQKYLPSSCRK